MDVILGFPKPLAFYVFSTKKEVQERLVIGISAGGMGVNETVMHVSIYAKLPWCILTTSSIVLTNYVNYNPNLNLFDKSEKRYSREV